MGNIKVFARRRRLQRRRPSDHNNSTFFSVTDEVKCLHLDDRKYLVLCAHINESLGQAPILSLFTDIHDDKLDAIPVNKCDILAASDSVGASYPFLMLELGLKYTDIETARANNQRDMRTVICTLLQQWRQQYPKEGTTRTLLDTARFVDIDTTEIQKRVMIS